MTCTGQIRTGRSVFSPPHLPLLLDSLLSVTFPGPESPASQTGVPGLLFFQAPLAGTPASCWRAVCGRPPLFRLLIPTRNTTCCFPSPRAAQPLWFPGTAEFRECCVADDLVRSFHFQDKGDEAEQVKRSETAPSVESREQTTSGWAAPVPRRPGAPPGLPSAGAWSPPPSLRLTSPALLLPQAPVFLSHLHASRNH